MSSLNPRKEASHLKKEATSSIIPLKGIRFDASIHGTVAKVKCTQFFKNEGDKPLEAIYVFPLPDEASVTSCEMRIGKNKTVKAELKEKKEARKKYDEAVEKGHHASLLEQKRDNVFTMNVGGIEPKEEVTVTIVYLQPVEWRTDGGRFRIPLVKAPVFIPGQPIGKSGGGWSPDTDQVPDASQITPVVAKEGVPYQVKINLKFTPGFACKLSCPSHPDIVPEKRISQKGILEIKTGEILPDRDFTLVYQSTSIVPEVSAHWGNFEKETFVFLNLIPPFQAKVEPADILFLLDQSGSMSGAKIEGLKVLVEKILRKLQEQNAGHRVGVAIFDNNFKVLSPLSAVTEEMIKKISTIRDGGGTELGPALIYAYQMFLDEKASRPRYIALVSDGQTESYQRALKVEETSEVQTVKKLLETKKIPIIACGLDTAINDTVLKEIARLTGGVNEWFFPGEDFDRAAANLMGDLSGPVLRQLEIKSEEGPVTATGLCDVFQGKPATVTFRTNGKISKVFVSGLDANGQKQEMAVDLVEEAEKCNFSHQIWARDFLRENHDTTEQTKISLKYNILCAHTSFVAISEKKMPGQKPEKVEVPVMLPHGWNYEKVFGDLLSSVGCSRLSTRRHSLHCYYLGTSIGAVDAGIDSIDLIEENETDGEAFLSPCLPSPEEDELPDSSSDDFIAILMALKQGERQKAEIIWQRIRALTVKEVNQWSEERKARNYYFLLRILSYGFSLGLKSFRLKSALAKEPKEGTVAMAWYILAMKETGRDCQKKYLLPTNPGEKQYLEWKMGKGGPIQNTASPWHNVL